MGTWDSSRFKVARKARRCDRCSSGIEPRQRYLAYKPGLHVTVAVCVECALTATYTSSASLYYDCAAVQAELTAPQAAA